MFNKKQSRISRVKSENNSMYEVMLPTLRFTMFQLRNKIFFEGLNVLFFRIGTFFKTWRVLCFPNYLASVFKVSSTTFLLWNGACGARIVKWQSNFLKTSIPKYQLFCDVALAGSLIQGPRQLVKRLSVRGKALSLVYFFISLKNKPKIMLFL